ncbi:hypothetical protein KCP77_10880 [Salmonella enterica subsp. enterica]|nr:hypothetical protein KCP77_10880 [Salmonella enterica subsp. enterica]
MPNLEAVQGGSYAGMLTFRLDLSVPQAFVDELEQGMFLRKLGSWRVPSIPRTMPASIAATIRILATVKYYARFTSGLNLLAAAFPCQL